MKEDLKKKAEMRADNDFYVAISKDVNLLDLYLDVSNRYFSLQTNDDEAYINYHYLFLMKHLERQLTYEYLCKEGYSFEPFKGWSKKED